ncbi:WD40 repeat domain-containing serine/threonine protein kinase [Cerasicoccus frondis]|uniref:WD40 repeat domain-containing serine/threonine protein kinase n=1 Tax=Cerasicoccus frondis TaxID=490090 RepID=UPI002852B44B|nr:WD40 repeat domain-containing serine/threonine protein kinase [Cerasicoccus frondis]
MDIPEPAAASLEKEIFLEAIDITNAQERADYVQKACGSDVELLDAVSDLLRSEDRLPSDFLDPDAYEGLRKERNEVVASLTEDVCFLNEVDLKHKRIGDYELLEEIGRGSMGVVFRARHLLLGREVALKIILNAVLASREERERFRVEAEAAAQLKHPHIVPIYEVGSQGGYEFYSMPMISGGTLRQKMLEKRFSPGEAVDLILCLADAIAAAHERGVIHRDLKPENILIDEHGEPHVGDFGLACRIDNEHLLTLTGMIMGTPLYMAPEIAQGGHRGVYTTAVDIYSLGAIFYELLSGVAVFKADSLMGMMAAIRDEAPRSLRSQDLKVDRDLETIVLKCLDKEPKGRYGAASALADDLRAWREHRPIIARPISAAERFGKWVRRRPLHAALFLVGMLLLLTLGIGGPVAALRESGLREQAELAQHAAENAKHQAEEAQLTAETARREAENSQKAAIEAADRAAKQAHANRRYAYTANMRFIALANQFREITKLAPDALITAWLPKGDEADLRGWEWYYTYGEMNQEGKTVHHREPVTSTSFSRFGGLVLVTHGAGCTIRNTLTGIVVRHLFDDEAHVQALWSPDDEFIASLTESGKVIIWNPISGHQEKLLPEGREALSISWSGDGYELAVLEASGEIGIWKAFDTGGYRMIDQFNLPEVRLTKIAWSPDGRYLAAIGDSEDVYVWPGEGLNGAPDVYQGHWATVTSLAWQQDASWLATGSEGGVLRIWGVPARERVARAERQDAGAVHGIAWNPDGNMLVFIQDESNEVIEANLLNSSTEPIFKVESPTAIAWSAEAYTIATGLKDGALKMTRVELPPSQMVMLEDAGPLRSLCWQRDGGSLSVLAQNGVIWRVDAIHQQAREKDAIGALDDKDVFAWNPLVGNLAIGRKAGRGHGQRELVEETSGGKDMRTEPYELNIRNLRSVAWLSPQEFLALSADGEIEAVRTRGKSKAVDFEKPAYRERAEYRKLSLSPDGRFLLGSGDSRRITVWSALSGAIVIDQLNEARELDESAHAWSPDGSRFATGNGEGVVTIFSTETGDQLFEFKAHQGPVKGMDWNPDGHRLATAGRDQQIRLWDTHNFEATLSLAVEDSEINAIAWGPDGRRLASVGKSSGLRIWDATPGILLSGYSE